MTDAPPGSPPKTSAPERRRPRVRYAHLALVLATLLPVLAFGGMLILRLDAQSRREVEATLRQGAHAAISATDRLIVAHLATLEALAASPLAGEPSPSAFALHAGRVLDRRGDWLALTLTDHATGAVLVARERPSAQGLAATLAATPLDPRLATGRAVVGGVERSETGRSEPFVLLQVPVTRDGAVRAVLSAAIRTATFSEVLDDQAIPPGWTVAILDRDRTILGRSHAPERFVGTAATPSLARRIGETSESLFFALNQEGERVYTAFRTSPFSGWTAAVGAPAALIEAPRRRALLLSIGGGVLAVGIAGLIAAALVRAATARNALERRLEAERRLSDVSAGFPGIIYRRAQDQDGRMRYTYASPGAAALLGSPVETAELEPLLRTVIHPDDRVGWDEAVRRSARTLEPYHLELRLVRTDGTVRWVQDSASPHRTDEGGVVWDGVLLDASGVKEAESALRESEVRFRTMADQSPLMIWVEDAQGRCVYQNRRWEEFTGQPNERALGDGWLACLHPDDLGPTRATRADARARRAPYRLDYRLRRHDGAYRWAIDAGAPRFGPDGDFLGYVGSVIDISDRKAMEEALRASDEHLRFALEAAQAGTWDYDVVQDRSTWSAGTFRLFGLDPARGAPGHAGWLERVVHPQDRDQTDRAFRDTLAQRRTTFRMEFRVLHPERGLRWISGQGRVSYAPDGTPLRASGLNLDVTERKLAEQERERLARTLETERKLLRAIVDHLPTGLSVAESPSGRLVLHNAEAVRLLGHAMGRTDDPWSAYGRYGALHEDGTPYRAEDYPTVRALRGGEEVKGLEMRYRRGDGRMTVFSANSAPVRDADGRVVLAITTFHDLSERKEIEEELRAALAEKDVLIGQKDALLKEKDTLLREVHHRVKNNLQVVLTLLQIEAMTVRRAADARDRLQAVGQRIHAMAQLHEQLYASESVARIELGRYLEELGRQVADIHAGQPVRITTDAERLLADPELAVPLGLIANELITNSLKHAFPDGRAGTIRVALRYGRGTGLVLSVEDDGVGQPLGDAPAEGGIGRLLVEALVQQLGATLRIETRAGTSTTVTVGRPEEMGLVVAA